MSEHTTENDAHPFRGPLRPGPPVVHPAENDAHRCATPPEAMPGDEWTCPACGLTYWADDTEETWGEGTFTWRVIPPAKGAL